MSEVKAPKFNAHNLAPDQHARALAGVKQQLKTLLHEKPIGYAKAIRELIEQARKDGTYPLATE